MTGMSYRSGDRDSSTHAWRRAEIVRVDRMRMGLVGSAALHGAAAILLFFALRSLPGAMPPTEIAMVVDLMPLGRSNTVSGEANAAVSAPPEAAYSPEPSKPEPVIEAPPSRPAPSAEIKPPKPPLSLDRIDRLVAALETSHRLAAAKADLAQPMGGGGPGGVGVLNVKDLIRAQVERRWELDVRTLGAAEVLVSIHLLLNPDGSVRSADIVDDPRFSSHPSYRAVALSARNAVLLSSPLQLPAGAYDAFKDVTVTFDPKDTSR